MCGLDVLALEAYTGKRALITGGLGYIGSQLSVRLVSLGCVARIWSRQGGGVCAGEGMQLVHGRYDDPGAWRTHLVGVDFVFHLAAQTSIAAAENDPLADFGSNVLPIYAFREALKHSGVSPSCVYSGTVTQCGLPSRLPVDESHEDDPVTWYDYHKLAAERQFEFLARVEGLRGTTLRLPNVFGPGVKNEPSRGVVTRMIRMALAGEVLTVYSNHRYVRDYVYVDDVVDALIIAAVKIDKTAGKHFVISSNSGLELTEVVETIRARVLDRTGKNVRVIHQRCESESRIDARDYYGTSARFCEATGWSASVSLSEGIDRTIEYFLARPNAST